MASEANDHRPATFDNLEADAMKTRARQTAYFPSGTEREKSPGTRLPGLSSFPVQAVFTARPYGTSSPARSQRASSAPTLHSPTAYPHDLRP
jgi:hypothetical protein